MDLDESLQKAIDEAVVLHEYDASWPYLFAHERDSLAHNFPKFIAIEHIGSTAVPGLSAKPIIDIMAGVSSLEEADALLEPLVRFGYSTSFEFNAQLTDRRWLMKHASGSRTHHLHLIVYGSTTWRHHLHFRDALRVSEELRRQYQRLKEELASTHRADRERYTESKARFIEGLQRECL